MDNLDKYQIEKLIDQAIPWVSNYNFNLPHSQVEFDYNDKKYKVIIKYVDDEIKFEVKDSKYPYDCTIARLICYLLEKQIKLSKLEK